MNLLAILLDGEPPSPEWQLFPWCIYFPALTIVISWALIRWRKKLVVMAAGIAAVAACMLINQLHADIRFLVEWEARLLAFNQMKSEVSALGVEPKLNEAYHKLTRLAHELSDLRQNRAIPPYYSKPMIAAVWFAALFPFIPIMAFFISAANPTKARKSLPASESSST